MQANWLPTRDDWQEKLRSLRSSTASGTGSEAADSRSPADIAATLRELATSRMDFTEVTRLDRGLEKTLAEHGGSLPGLDTVRVAVLGSATTSHLPSGMRVAALRRGLALTIYEAPYGMYWQELMDQTSGLYGFQPQVLLLALDARHVAQMGAGHEHPSDAVIATLRRCWRRARERFGCQVIQQTILPVLPPLMGNHEARLAQSPAAIIARVNEQLQAASAEEGVDLLAIDRASAADGLAAWHDPGIWHRSKHEVHPSATEAYGEQVARVIAAARGRSYKCLVLDLDNTLWGGVIGDDGLDGIVLGQGSGTGEAYSEFQRYAIALADRGVILAVCSKNDERNALEAFEKHPEMQLRREHIACFVANWTDKATNLRHIAKTLNIGLDALVFADDNPVERALVRRELPMIAVPELPEDPALYAQTIAAAGYFESLQITDEDRQRSQLYQANAERARSREALVNSGESGTDMSSYLASLDMTMTVRPFDRIGLTRITQLINKTNQFNLTTQRRTEAEVEALMHDPQAVTMQVRLVDRFGDNGIIAVIIARLHGTEAAIETWLMSCRVLGRQVEEACLNELVDQVRSFGVERLMGEYRPTEKNGIVREHYRTLGFTLLEEIADGSSRWQLALPGFTARPVVMRIESQPESVEVH